MFSIWRARNFASSWERSAGELAGIVGGFGAVVQLLKTRSKNNEDRKAIADFMDSPFEDCLSGISVDLLGVQCEQVLGDDLSIALHCVDFHDIGFQSHSLAVCKIPDFRIHFHGANGR